MQTLLQSLYVAAILILAVWAGRDDAAARARAAGRLDEALALIADR